AGAVAFLEPGVKERNHPVSKLEVFSDDPLVVLPEPPGLLVVLAPLVIAAHGSQESYLIPPRQQFSVPAADESAYIGSDERFARQAQRLKHRNAQRQRLPGAGVIAGPHGRVPLNSGVSGAGDDVRPHARSQP